MRPRAPVVPCFGFLAVIAPLALVSLAGCTGETAEASEPTLDEVRAATEKYRDVEVALADGYIADPTNTCETAEMMGHPAELGAIGIHYFRPDVLGITGPPNPRVNGTGTHVDFGMPSILIYEPQADGSLELVAVENLAFRAPWDAAGHTEPPSYQGVSFDLMEDDPSTPADEAHGFEPHYDLHVWLHRPNPAGMFTTLNPDVSCGAHVGGAEGMQEGHGH